MKNSVLILVLELLFAVQFGMAADRPDPAPMQYPDQPQCQVKSVQMEETVYENVGTSSQGVMAMTQPDKKGVYQLYTKGPNGAEFKCISCDVPKGGPRLDRNKPMIAWHPSGQWLFVGIEEDKHDNKWMPGSWQRGLLQSGIWLNMWVTTPSGDRWYQLTDFKKSKENPSDGMVGPTFTPDGKRAVWAEIVDGNVFANKFGVWKLMMGDFVVSADGVPTLENRKDITPKGARWIEPGNFAPDGRRMLISSDIGMKDARGQDQYILDVETGQVTNLTNTPLVWDEHGIFSSDGSKISFMSSHPFRDPKGKKMAPLKTEFMLMDADGSHLQRITHFNTPGHPESQKKDTIAAVAVFKEDGLHLFGMVMSTDGKFGKTNWTITFEGPCGLTPESSAAN